MGIFWSLLVVLEFMLMSDELKVFRFRIIVFVESNYKFVITKNRHFQ